MEETDENKATSLAKSREHMCTHEGGAWGERRRQSPKYQNAQKEKKIQRLQGLLLTKDDLGGFVYKNPEFLKEKRISKRHHPTLSSGSLSRMVNGKDTQRNCLLSTSYGAVCTSDTSAFSLQSWKSEV